MSSRLLLILCPLVLLASVIEGDYRVLVTVNSFELLESRCFWCYTDISTIPGHRLCCDGQDSVQSCPNTCDVTLAFCKLDFSGRTGCNLTSESQFYTQTFLGNDFTAEEVHQYDKNGSVGLINNTAIQNPVEYMNTGRWVAGQVHLQLLVIDMDYSGDLNDLIDGFLIPINISAGSSFTRNYTGFYSQIELTIEVRCVGDDMDENCVLDHCRINNVCNNAVCVNDEDKPLGYECVCLPGLDGPNCTNIMECAPGICNNGTCTQSNENSDYRCECLPGFSGMLCEHNIDDCVGVACNNGGTCVDGVDTFSCVCDPGYTGDMCDTEIVTTTALSTDGGVTTALSTDGEVSTSTDEGLGIFETNGGVTTVLSTDGEVVDVSSLPLAAIVGGAVGGVVCVLILAIVIVLALLIFTRIRKTKTFDIQESTYDDTVFSNQIVSKGGQVPIYEEADVNRKGHKSDTGGSETLKQFNNPIYGDDDNIAELELEHEYETTDQARSKTVRNEHEQDQYSELERKFENPIYGDDSNGDEYEQDQYSKLDRKFEHPIKRDDNNGDKHEQDQYSKLDRKFEHPIKNDDNKGDEREPDQYSKLERKFEHPKSDDNNGDEREPDQYSKLERKFEHPVHGDDNKSDEHLQDQYSKLERKFEKPINGDDNNAGAKHEQDQYSKLEKKFENPIYGDDNNGEEGNTNSATLQQDNYDQIGNIYHTLESGKEREERYAQTSLSGSAPETSGVKEWSGGPANKSKHSYEDMD